MSKYQVVVWDPKNEFWEGSLVESAKAAQLESRGVVMLPVSPEAFKRGTGFVRRAWGAGFPLDAGISRMHAPLSMLVFRDYVKVHWAARLASTPEFDANAKTPGFRNGGLLRFVGDGRELVQHINVVPLTGAVDLQNLGEKDGAGGWTVKGAGEINPHLDGHYGFSLYGTGAGLRVVWLAMTITTNTKS